MSNQQQQQPSHSHEALFNAPTWGTKLLTVATMLGMLAVVSLFVGIGLAAISKNAIPLALGVLLAAFMGLPAALLQWLTRKSLNAMYGNTKTLQAAGLQQTVVSMDRPITIDGKQHSFKKEQFTVDAPADQVARMLSWIKDNPTRMSRTQVMQNTRVSQSTWEKVMTALEEAGIVVNGGKSGYKTLDDKLDELDARL